MTQRVRITVEGEVSEHSKGFPAARDAVAIDNVTYHMTGTVTVVEVLTPPLTAEEALQEIERAMQDGNLAEFRKSIRDIIARTKTPPEPYQPHPQDLVSDLQRALHGESWASADSPKKTWMTLLREVVALGTERNFIKHERDAAYAALREIDRAVKRRDFSKSVCEWLRERIAKVPGITEGGAT